MKFEWDVRKAAINWVKHGLTFENAVTAFDDPDAWIMNDRQHSTDHEKREVLIGKANHGIMVVVFTRRRDGAVIRIISSRRAKRKERKLYEQSKDV